MARPARPSGAGELIASLVRTREAIERLVARLDAIHTTAGSLSVSDEQALRRARRALRKINADHLPWARSPAFTPAQAAGIAFWLIGVWSTLPLEDAD
jgi:hypothetical protein